MDLVNLAADHTCREPNTGLEFALYVPSSAIHPAAPFVNPDSGMKPCRYINLRLAAQPPPLHESGTHRRAGHRIARRSYNGLARLEFQTDQEVFVLEFLPYQLNPYSEQQS